MISCLLISSMFLPLLNNLNILDNFGSSTSAKLAPMQIGAKILRPRLGVATFALKGGQFEVKVRGPSTINAWSFILFREYRSYDLTYNTPNYDPGTGIYTIDVNVPAAAIRDLYDLQITVSDGSTQETLVEENSVQVLYEYPSDFTIFHITDTHIGQYSSAPKKLLYSLYQAAMYNADLILITGDLVDSFPLEPVFDQFLNIIRQSRVPIFVGPGNHDRDETGDSYSTYMSYFGPDYYTFNMGPDIFVISSNTHHSPYEFNSTQLSWIEADLAASTAQVKILMHHAPLIQPDEEEYFISEAEATEIIRITNTYGVDLVLTGHRHNDRVDIIGNTIWIMTGPNGGSAWSDPSDPGHHQNAFRIIRFENYKPVYWNWTVDPADGRGLSQPWDKLVVSRTPKNFREQDAGGYMYLHNTLNYSLDGLVVDFIMNPLPNPAQYVIHNATLLEKFEGSDAWLLRLTLDLPAGNSTVILLYPDNAQPPVFQDVWSDDPGLVLSATKFFANMSNEYGGILYMQINISYNEGSYSVYSMGRVTNTLFRYVGVFLENGTGDYQVFAFGYAGNNSTSSFYNFTVTERPTTPVLQDLPHNTTTGNFWLNWTESTDPDGSVSHYEFQMSASNDFATLLQQWETSATEYNMTLSDSGHYFFRVRAIDNLGGPSYWSNIEDIFVLFPTPPPPDGTLFILIAGGVIAVVVIVIVGIYVFKWRKKTSGE